MSEQQVNIILERSEGLFLYTRVVLKEIRLGRLSLERPDEFPLGLRAFYKRFFERQFSDPERYERYQRPLLEIAASAQEPPSVEFLGLVLGWDMYVRKRSLDPLSSFFYERDGRLVPFHRTILDWLTDQTTEIHFVVDPMRGHKALAEAGWSQYKQDPLSMHPYFAHLARHLLVLQRWSELETLLTDLRFLEFVFRVDAGVTLLDEYTCLEKRLKAVPTGMADSKSGLAKLSALARFVRAEFQNRPICRRVPFFCIQQAFNSAPGPLREMAQLLLAEVPVWFERLAPIYEQSLAHETLGKYGGGHFGRRKARGRRARVRVQSFAIFLREHFVQLEEALKEPTANGSRRSQ